MKRIILKGGEEDRIRGGHPWVYDNEVEKILDTQGRAAELLPGELAELETFSRGRPVYLGRAFVNPRSRIIARLFSPSKEGVDKGFFKRRLRESIARRRGYDLSRESARLVFAEADFLPGLIIDRFTGWPAARAKALEFGPTGQGRPLTFEALEAAQGKPGSWVSVQFLIAAMDSRREEILAALEEVLGGPSPGGDARGSPLGGPQGIVEKSRALVREAEGLPLREGLLRGSFPPEGIVIFEDGLPFLVHLEEGQKTGHFLDQRENRRLAARYAVTPGGGGRVLDAYCYTGGFGIHAARAGAASVLFADSSAAALETVKRNALLNGVEDRIGTVRADIFELLPRLERSKETFDLIILDPPAFAKGRSALEGALRGYREINRRALALLRRGGFLVTCSCSQALEEGRFRRLIAEAALDAGRRLILRDFRFQAPDHPILVGYDESLYLKCGFYQAL